MIDRGVIQKELFAEEAWLKRVSSISRVGSLVWVSGEHGALSLSGRGRVRSVVRFDARVGTVIPFDWDGDGDVEFLNTGGGWQPVSLMDGQGRTQWQLDGWSPAPNDLTAGDLSGNGRIGFVVGFNGGGGVARLDARGQRVWERSGSNVFTVEVADVDGDGTVEILHSSHGDGIVIRDAGGTQLRTLDVTSGPFSLTRWPALGDQQWIAHSGNGTLDLVDFAGELRGRLPLPVGGFSVNQAIPVRLRAGEPNDVHFAVVRTIHATGRRSALFLYDSDGKLIYTEVFLASRLALAAIPDEQTGAEVLLVGAQSRVFAYRLKRADGEQRDP